ncbi:hypothetical protein CDD83_2873 [Cordyceps sp. RAO-2017]|nr:hypothetical protein CDD83_2873 [Cordyceps sp. RAO-2017]
MGFPGRELLFPQYAIHNKAAYMDDWNSKMGGLSNRTVSTDVIHQNGLAMFDTHNLYGSMMSTASYEAMLARRPGLRPLIITRSTFAGAGAKVGHWLGDNVSTWEHYRNSIRSMLAFSSLYAFSMVGSDVCGFGGNTTEELCARWAALGAFSTFYRNHNSEGSIPQEFYRWERVAESARRAIDIRYRLLDYLYTAMWRASTDGTPAVQPVFFHYPADRQTWALDLLYFYGPGLLVAPVVDEGATEARVYLPPGALFYDWYSHEPIRGAGREHILAGHDVTSIPLLIRGGAIVPARLRSAPTTAALRREGLELLVALDADGRAAGELYLDDGVALDQAGRDSHVEFAFARGSLSIRGSFASHPDAPPPAVRRVVVLAPDPPGNAPVDRTAGRPVLYSRTFERVLELDREHYVRFYGGV